MLRVLKFHLQQAQNCMKQLADKHGSKRHFAIGDLVFVKLHSYRQVSVAQRANAKLSPTYIGPFQVVDRVGVVAYKLAFPTSSLA